ncbi:MAG: STAS domain-containing protein [Planctomycetota bacterium]|nr:STAS domain-containing protein [Planctomycetota bacterium]
MDYIIEDVGTVSIVRFDGDLGGGDDADLKHLFVLLRQQGKTNVVADMTKVGFMDSTVIGLFVWGMKNLREVGGDWRMFGISGAVLKIFEITHLDRAFQIFHSESEALESFA